MLLDIKLCQILSRAISDVRWNAQELVGTDGIMRPQGVNMHVLYHCRLQDVRPFVFKRGWYWEGLPCVLVLRPHEGTLRCHLVLAIHSSGDHAAPRPIRTEQPCAREVPARPKLVLLPEATVRNEYRHRLPSLHLQDRLGSAQDSVHEGQHNVHPDHCGIKSSLKCPVYKDTLWNVLYQLFCNCSYHSGISRVSTSDYQNVCERFSPFGTSKISVFGLPIGCLMELFGVPALAWNVHLLVTSLTKEAYPNLAKLPLNFNHDIA